MSMKRVMNKLSAGLLALAMIGSLGAVGGTPLKAFAAENGVTQPYESLFQSGKVIDVKVTIADDDWKSILASPLDKAYKNVTVDVDGHVLSNVGFSTKGNLTLKAVASMTDSDRYSFRLKFDKYDKTQTLLGLDKLALNNNYSDPSYMREYLHYEALRAIGLDAPLITYVNLYINGELYGFYSGIEDVDDSYLERNFGEDYEDGVLYDTDENSYLQYKEGSDYDSLTYETGTEDNKASLKNFIKVLNDMPDGEKGDIESVLDVSSALKYIAANAVLGSYDSYNGDKGHNYLLYGSAAGKYTVIPWDFNMSFNGYTGGGGRGGAAGTTADGASATTSTGNTDATTANVNMPVLGIDMASVPMINKLLEVPSYKAKYLGYVSELVTYLKGIQARITTLAAWIKPYVEADPTKFYTLAQFESNVTYSSTGDVATGGMQGGGGTPPTGTPPTGTPPTGTPPTGTEAEGVTGTTDAAASNRPDQMNGNPGQGMGTMAAGSIMTFALNRLVNLEQQLGLEVTTLPVTLSPSTSTGTTNAISVLLNGKAISFSDQQPVNVNGRVLVPVASIFSAYGATVKWDSATQTVTAVKDNTKIVLTIGSKKAYVNGTAVALDVPASLVNNRTLVPVRLISESLQMKVVWNAAAKTVTITNA